MIYGFISFHLCLIILWWSNCIINNYSLLCNSSSSRSSSSSSSSSNSSSSSSSSSGSSRISINIKKRFQSMKNLYQRTCILWLLYFPNINDQPFRSVIISMTDNLGA